MKAMDEFKLREGLIITEDLDTEENVDGKKNKVPALMEVAIENPLSCGKRRYPSYY